MCFKARRASTRDYTISFPMKTDKMGGHTCVVCDDSKNACAHAHRIHVLEVFSHEHVQLHIACVRVRTHLRNPPFADNT